MISPPTTALIFLHCGGLLTQVFDMGGREVKVQGEGCLVFNSTLMALEAAVAADDLAYLLKDRVQACLAETEPMILENINLTVEPGQFMTIMGPSGGGKTARRHSSRSCSVCSSGQAARF
jgi:ABC-type multidrug transport system fused ATPase/permease subunit